MNVVVDSNRIIAALIRNSTCRQILLHAPLNFLTVNFGHKEIEKYRSYILKKSELTEAAFNHILTGPHAAIDCCS